MRVPEIHLNDYLYDLPESSIADQPVSPRDSSRLLVYRKGEIDHTHFLSLHEQLPENSLLIFNNTRVIPARLFFRKESGASIEILLLEPRGESVESAMQVRNETTWKVIIGNLKKWKPGEQLIIEVPFDTDKLQVKAQLTDRENRIVRLNWSGGRKFSEILEKIGTMPLPPYIKRAVQDDDSRSYQTVYAKPEGAIAAPTAGLHFTGEAMQKLRDDGVDIGFVTLHVGAGTFLPVKHEIASEHPMHSERIIFDRSLIDKLLLHKGPCIAVGTTSMRSLESLFYFGALLEDNKDVSFFIPKLYPYSGKTMPSRQKALENVLRHMDKKKEDSLEGLTEIMIMPGYSFRVCHGLLTNFHQPGSTLIMLVAAFIGNNWKDVYREALAKGYRFLSYGDSSLLLP